MVFLYDLTMAEIMRRIIAVILYAGLQGGIFALLLTLLGERRVSEEGRLTAQPFAHLSLGGIFLGLVFRTTWTDPMPITPARGNIKPLLALLLTVGGLMAVIPLLDLARSPLHAALPRSLGYMVLAQIETLQIVILASAVFALLPLPGLPLGTTLPAIFPTLAKPFRKWAGMGMAAAAILLVLGWWPDLSPVMERLRLV